MTHRKILAILAGASSQKPMAFEDLVKASGLSPATLLQVLDQMAHSIPATINCASITKAGKTQMLYWPTGVIDKAAQPFRINNEKAAGFVTQARPALAHPNTSIPSKEIPMSMPPSKLNTIIYNRIAEQPGIAQDALLQFVLHNVAGSTEKQVKKTIANLVHSSKKIRSEGSKGKFTYYLNNEAGQPAAAASSVVKKQEAKPDADSFSIMLSEDNFLHVCSGKQKMVFSKVQTERLWNFIGRTVVHPA